MAEPPPTYTREEMDAILKRALERQQAKSEEIAHEDLVSAAGEVGIPREEVEAAARDLEAERAKSRPAAAADAGGSSGATRGALAPPDEARARAVRGFFQRATMFFGLSMFFVLVGHETHANWWIWPVFGMGVSLVIQASRVLFGDWSAERRGAERRPSRRERRQMRREERLADFEQKVAIGAEALVRVIDEARNAKTRVQETLKTAREGGGSAPRVIVTPPPADAARARVDPKYAREADTLEREPEPSDAGRDARRNRGG